MVLAVAIYVQYLGTSGMKLAHADLSERARLWLGKIRG